MDLHFQIRQHVDTVFEYLTDMQKYTSVHPVITKIDTVGDGRYLIHETLKLGFIPFSFTYSAIVNKDYDGEITMSATIKSTKIDMTFNVYADNGFTIIDETIVVKSHLPIQSIMNSIFRKQHTQLFANIEKLEHGN